MSPDHCDFVNNAAVLLIGQAAFPRTSGCIEETHVERQESYPMSANRADMPRIGRPAYDADAIAERRTMILDAALALVPKLGTDNVRLKDIAAEARISVGALQHYFETRDDLLEAAFAHHARRVVDGINAAITANDSPWGQVQSLIERFSLVGDVKSRSALWVEFAAGSARDPQLRRLMGQTYAEWRTILSNAISAGMSDGTFAPLVNGDQAVDGVCALLDGYEVANAIEVWRDDGTTTRTVLLQLVSAIIGYAGEGSGREPKGHATLPR
jgi:AcrR family transcriptional regulator